MKLMEKNVLFSVKKEKFMQKMNDMIIYHFLFHIYALSGLRIANIAQRHDCHSD